MVAIVGPSDVVGLHWQTPLGLVFIDGGHGSEPAHRDYETWAPKVATGGLLAIHDVFPDPAEVGVLTVEVACDSQLLFNCAPPPGVPAQYPQTTKVTLKPLPTKQLATMPDPCKGVPANPWCPVRTFVDKLPPPQASQSSGSGLPNTGLAIGVPLAGLALLGAGASVVAVRRRTR